MNEPTGNKEPMSLEAALFKLTGLIGDMSRNQDMMSKVLVDQNSRVTHLESQVTALTLKLISKG